MFDMRYHIASLVAVFFALAIGIILGTVIVDKGILVDEQRSLVQRIERNFEILRVENRLLSEEVSKRKTFTDRVVPLTMKGRLDEKNVVVITTAQVDDKVALSLLDALRKAGAKVISIKVKDDYEITDRVITQLKPYFSTELDFENTRELMLRKLVEDLAVSVVTTSTASTSSTTIAGNEPFLSKLIGLQFIEKTTDDTDQGGPVNSAVILGGADNNLQDPSETDLPLINQLKTQQVRVVGVETSDCKKSYMRVYQSIEIPTVDNIDQPEGIISTIFTLMGTDGNFGIKRTAGSLMPNP